MNQIAKEWQDYEVIDTGNKEKLERWNQTILRRPDPVAIWHGIRPMLFIIVLNRVVVIGK